MEQSGLEVVDVVPVLVILAGVNVVGNFMDVVLSNVVMLDSVVVSLGGGVVVQEYPIFSTSHVALQYAVKHHPKPSVTLYINSPVNKII